MKRALDLNCLRVDLNRLGGWLLVFLLGLSAGQSLADTEFDSLEQEARALAAGFGAQLLATVRTAMAEDGPEQAIAACQLAAPSIAHAFSQQGWQVGRTSTRLRNPQNAPDVWELSVLKDFERRSGNGAALQELRHAAVVDGEFRYMQAIPLGEPCLACHGSQIAPTVQAVLQQRYPADQATGFRQGELRGAFTLRRAWSGQAATFDTSPDEARQ